MTLYGQSAGQPIMSKILGVGIATLDIINRVEHYPGADDEVRALSQVQVRGGNVTNTLVVLAQMRIAPVFFSWAVIVFRFFS